MSGDRLADAAEILRPHLATVLACLPEDRFTTRQYLLAFRELPDTAKAYEDALAIWGEDRRLALLAIHGNVVPQLLRRSGLAEWLGFIGGVTEEHDGLHVPARWRKRAST